VKNYVIKRGKKLSLLIFYLSMITQLYASILPQYIILGADKNRDNVTRTFAIVEDIFAKDKKVNVLKDRYGFKSEIISLGDYYAVKISPINIYRVKEYLTILLKPKFPDLFTVDVYQHENIKSDRYYTTTYKDDDALSTMILKSIDKDHIKKYAKKTHYWIERWHVLIVLLLLGGFFYYRRRYQIESIRLQQQDLSKEQDAIEVKIKNI